MQVNRTVCEALAACDGITIFNGELLETWNLVADNTLLGRSDDDIRACNFCLACHWRDKRAGFVGVLGNDIADLHIRPALNLWNTAIKWQLKFFLVLGGDLNNIVVAFFPNIGRTADICEICLSFWCANFKELLDTRQTSRNVFTCDTTGVEGLQRQLRTWFTNGLCGDNTCWVVARNKLTSCWVNTVALARNTTQALYAQYTHDLNVVDVLISVNCICNFFGNEFALLYKAFYFYGCKTSLEAATIGNTNFLGIFAAHFKAWVLNIFVGRKDILSDINEAACEVPRVSGLKSGVDHTLTCTAGGGKVFERTETLLIVAADRKLNGTSGCIGGHTKHTNSSFDLADVTTSTRDNSNRH